LAIAPSAWPYWLAGTAVNHAIVTFAGLWPRSSLLGANWTRLPQNVRTKHAIALTIDDGPDPRITPRVLDMLDEHGIRASFFCIGARAALYPDIVRDIVARGHAVENHSQRHRHTFSVSFGFSIAKEVAAAQTTLTALTGTSPAFFRAPAGLRNVFLDLVLQRADLRLATWTRRGFDTREGDAAVVAKKLIDGLRERDILLLHDGSAAYTPNGEPVILLVLPLLAAAAKEQSLRFIMLRDAL